MDVFYCNLYFLILIRYQRPQRFERLSDSICSNGQEFYWGVSLNTRFYILNKKKIQALHHTQTLKHAHKFPQNFPHRNSHIVKQNFYVLYTEFLIVYNTLT